jgi:type IV pilus assembly protein PilM
MTIPVSPADGMGNPGKMGGGNPGAAAMLRIIGELADELRRSIDFYLNQGDNLEVAQLAAGWAWWLDRAARRIFHATIKFAK